MENEVDILENDIREQYPEVFETLLGNVRFARQEITCNHKISHNVVTYHQLNSNDPGYKRTDAATLRSGSSISSTQWQGLGIRNKHTKQRPVRAT